MDFDQSLGKLVDSKAASYFGYDPTMRQVYHHLLSSSTCTLTLCPSLSSSSDQI
jgi:hypothetical protein